MPKALVRRMVAAGAIEEKVLGEDLRVIRIMDGISSPSWALFQDWASELGEVDPVVSALISPSDVLVGTTLVPNLALYGALQLEANSLIYHHAPLLMQAFEGGVPVIPGPLAAVPLPITVHHAKVAVTSLINSIQHPPPAYPIISGLGAGGYICTVWYVWTGAVVTVDVFKPA